MKRTYIIALASLLSCLPGYPATVRTATETFVTNKISQAVSAAALSATNYTDNVATTLRGEIAAATPEDYDTVKSNATVAAEAVAGLGDLAWIDGLEWSAIIDRPTTWAWSAISGKPTTWAWSNISDKPSWIGDTKPTYSLNDVCPNVENWLGVQGNAGRHIKVLAGTAGGQIVGGMRITASTQNDNNMTTYTYGGVAVKRSGVNTDYLWDVSSQNGVVRRSELAAITPGDYATVSNRAVNSVQKGDIPEYTETNAVSTIVWHYGAETLAIPSGGTLSASTTGWKNGESMFLVLSPSGSYTVDANAVDLVGYNAWPTNTTLCVAFRYGSKILVNPITATE